MVSYWIRPRRVSYIVLTSVQSPDKQQSSGTQNVHVMVDTAHNQYDRCLCIFVRTNTINQFAGMILGIGSTNRRKRYIVTPHLIGQAHIARTIPVFVGTDWCSKQYFH